MLVMLMNYPIEHISNVTDGYIQEKAFAKRSKNPDSIAALSANLVDKNKDIVSNGEPVADVRLRRGSAQFNIYQNNYLESVRYGNGPKMLNASENNSVHPSTFQKDKLVTKKEGVVSRSSSKKGSLINNSFSAGGPVLRKQASSDSINTYQIECTTINNMIRQYVVNLVVELDTTGTGKIYVEQFKTWIDQHKPILKHFEDNFHVDIWKSVLNKSTQKQTLGYKLMKPEINFYANYLCLRSSKKKERVWVELHKKFLICLLDKEQVVPRRVILLDGLTLTQKQTGNDLSTFELSHKCPNYKTVSFELEDKDSFKMIMKKLSYLQE